MTKIELLNTLQTIQLNFIIGLMMPNIITEKQWIETSKDEVGLVLEGVQEFSEPLPIKKLCTYLSLKNRIEGSKLFGEFEKCMKRMILKEGNELIDDYCKKTNQLTTFQKNKDLYVFSRIMRHITSHSNGEVLNKWDLKTAQTATWRGRTINNNMIGKSIEFSLFESYKLLEDQIEFVKTELI